MPDPSADLVVPQAGSCTHRNVSVNPKQFARLRPGTYCGGLTLMGTVRLDPGLYAIEGFLDITSHATVVGERVTFALSGSQAGFSFDAQGTTTLRASRSGTYGGILVT